MHRLFLNHQCLLFQALSLVSPGSVAQLINFLDKTKRSSKNVLELTIPSKRAGYVNGTQDRISFRKHLLYRLSNDGDRRCVPFAYP